MNTNKQKYFFAWIVLGMLIVSATFLLIVSVNEFNAKHLQLALSFLSWVFILAIGIYLFFGTSNRILKIQIDTEENVTPALKQTSASPRNETDHLDIQGLAGKITRKVSPDHHPEKWGMLLLKILVSEIEIMSGVVYHRDENNLFKSVSTYALPHSSEPYSFLEGEGITGQVAKNKQVSVFRSIPEDYRHVFSGLGTALPTYLAIVPIVINDRSELVIELAGFKWSDEKLEHLFQIIARELAEKIESKEND